MKTVNLRDYYYWYTQDEFIEVSDEVAAELNKSRCSQKTHKQRMRRNKSFYSLDRDDGIEASAVDSNTYNPEAIFTKMDEYCRLCYALNSLPEIQGRRVEAHYLLGKTQTEIAEAEGVKQHSVSESIMRGLQAMKKILNNFEDSPIICPQSEAGI